MFRTRSLYRKWIYIPYTLKTSCICSLCRKVSLVHEHAVSAIRSARNFGGFDGNNRTMPSSGRSRSLSRSRSRSKSVPPMAVNISPRMNRSPSVEPMDSSGLLASSALVSNLDGSFSLSACLVIADLNQFCFAVCYVYFSSPASQPFAGFHRASGTDVTTLS